MSTLPNATSRTLGALHGTRGAPSKLLCRPLPPRPARPGRAGRCEALDPRQSRLVECRYFGGMTIEETAQIMDLSVATVKRDWATARAWLYRDMQDDAAP